MPFTNMMLRLFILLALLWPGVSWAAVVSTGTPQDFVNVANTGTQGMTVPADAEFMACGVVGFISAVSPFSGNGATALTIGGASMTYIGGDSDTSKMTGGIFYKVLPATGAQTLAWDWTGTSAMEGGTHFACRYYKGINTGGAVRNTNATQQAASPHTSGTLTASSGDLIIAYSWQFVSSANRTFTWTGATEVAAFANNGEVDDSWAEASPTGNQTVSTSVSESSDGGIGAIVLIAAGGGGGSSTPMRLPLLQVGP
jgi:hypothetical protein